MIERIACSLVLAALGLNVLAPNASAQSIKIDHAYRISFPESSGVHSAVFSADGKSVFVDVAIQPVDAWGALVYLWPEVLGGVVLIATLLAAFLLVRVARRRRRAGVPYCRKCNYDLTGQSQGRCPECGVETTSVAPVIGRPFMRRVGPMLAIWLVLASGYGAMWAFRLPRSGSASRWLNWPSERLAREADARQIGWLQKWKCSGEKVVEVDLATGKVTRTIAVRTVASYMDMSLTPDGRSVVLAGVQGLSLVDVRSGRERAQVHLPGEPMVDVHGEQVLGYSLDGKTAYVHWVGRQDGICGVSAWNLETGAATTIVKTSAYHDPRANGGIYGRRFLRVGREEPPRFISVPTFMESFGSKSFVVRVHGADGSSEKSFDLGTAVDCSATPAITPDGGSMFLTGQYGHGILGFVPTTGESLGRLNLPMQNAWDTPALNAPGTLLAVPSHGPIELRDTTKKAWVASLRVPSQLIAPRPGFSEDGKWLLAVCQIYGGPGAMPLSRNTHELLIWKLPETEAGK